ncbi:hypothetical protein [Nostoc sp. JL23]|nr:hypothetical protein [Nostoc sp. JL23]
MSSLEIASSLDGWGIGAIAQFSRTERSSYFYWSVCCAFSTTLSI